MTLPLVGVGLAARGSKSRKRNLGGDGASDSGVHASHEFVEEVDEIRVVPRRAEACLAVIRMAFTALSADPEGWFDRLRPTPIWDEGLYYTWGFKSPFGKQAAAFTDPRRAAVLTTPSRAFSSTEVVLEMESGELRMPVWTSPPNADGATATRERLCLTKAPTRGRSTLRFAREYGVTVALVVPGEQEELDFICAVPRGIQRGRLRFYHHPLIDILIADISSQHQVLRSFTRGGGRSFWRG
jgi:hypothetical protein